MYFLFWENRYNEAMRVISKRTLVEFWSSYPDAEPPLSAWFIEASKAQWMTAQHIKDRYRSASFLADNRVVFNIGGNKYRLIVRINYVVGIVYIRFVGTHKQYDHINAEVI